MQQKTITLILILMLSGAFSFAQKKEIVLNTDWQAKRASEVLEDGTQITSPTYKGNGWIDAVVPGTVQTTMLHNNLIPDMFYGMNNELIPDIYDVGADFYTFWFRNKLEIPELKPEQQAWLKFRGINYSANVFLNGARVNSDTHEGMYLRQKYLITPHLHTSKANNLAVIVHPPNPVGEANGGQGGDGMIGRSVTQQFSAGWDWICAIRDRNTGIWDEVSVEITGPVDIRNPYVKTQVPGKRVPNQKQAPAFISISTDLVNATDKEQTGILIAKIGEKQWTKDVTIRAGETLNTVLPEIKKQDPKLWWSNGFGTPHLYQLELSFVQNKEESDKEVVNFGIRETSNYFDEVVGGRVFLINGQKIFIKGGNWIASDALMRLSAERYDAEVRMHAQMNMNMIRVWGGSITERPEFYKACDKYGILVWQDLWISGDGNGRWKDPKKRESQARRRAYPDDHSLFITSAIDQIKMLRNHPSLYMWCGGNEFAPPEDINQQLEDSIFPFYDGNRYYLNESTSDSLLRNTIGGNGDGPYGIQDPLRFFTTPSYPFNPEIGSVGVPNVETMRKMMDEKDLEPPVRNRGNDVWSYHKYIGYNNTIERFGEISGIDDFCKKAQIVNYEQYRALQEGFNAGMWNDYTGMLVWKNQNPWTSLRGQFYDVFLDQTGGLYGYQHGAKPLHVQLNLNDSSLMIVNQTLNNQPKLKVEAHLFDLHGTSIGSESYQTGVAANDKKVVGKLFEEDKPEGFYFARLVLKDDSNTILHENLYWLVDKEADWQQLEQLKAVQPKIKIEDNQVRLKRLLISNPEDETAFFIRLTVNHKDGGDLALPIFFEDNYITLFPGEKREVWIDLSHLPEKVDTRELQFKAEAWNSDNSLDE